MKFKLWEFLLSLFLIVVFGTAGYLFYIDITKDYSQGKGEPIGTVTFRKNTTQRKFSDRVIWQDLPTKAFVYDNDSIRTLVDAQAVLLLNDSTEILLEDNSLVTLQWTKRTIDFQGGNISATRSTDLAKGTAEVFIRSQSATVSLDKASVQISQKKDGNVGIVVSDGQASVKMGDKVEEIDKKKQVTINKEKKDFVVQQIPVSLLVPSANANYITFDGSFNIPFSWSLPEGWVSGNLEISSNMEFDSPRTLPIQKQLLMNLPISPGTWFWRVLGASEKGASLGSGIKKFTVQKDKVIQLTAPKDQGNFRYSIESPVIRFSWSESPLAIAYEIDIATELEMKNLVIHQKTESTNWVEKTLQKGTYYWKIHPIYSAQGLQGIMDSPIWSFNITQTQASQAPEVLLPKDGEKFLVDDLTDGKISILWKGDDNNTEFEVRLASDIEFKNILVNRKVSGTTLLIPETLKPGNYYYTIGIINGDGKIEAVTAAHSFSVDNSSGGSTLLTPENNEIEEWNPLKGVNFSWKSNRARAFIIELSRTKTFEDTGIIQRTSQNSVIISQIDSGVWHWRIKELDKTGAVVFISEPRSFTLLPPLKKPILVAPAPAGVVALPPTGMIEFQWQSVPGAVSYDLQIYQNGRLLEEKLKLNSNRVTLKRGENWTPGDYVWSLKANGVKVGSSNVEQVANSSSTFSLEDAPVFLPPTLVYPRSTQVVSGLENIRNGIVFQWKLTAPLSKSILTVYKSGNKDAPIHKVTTDQFQSILSGLVPGKYFWKVESFTTSGQIGPVSSENEFTIAEIPGLATPIPLFPGAAQVVDMTEAASLSLRWQGVIGAQIYEVKLFRGNDPKPLLALSGIKSTEVVFQDLSKLDVGNFYWTVQAFNTDTKGALFQKSPIGQANFKIILKDSEATVNITSPEVQYAP